MVSDGLGVSMGSSHVLGLIDPESYNNSFSMGDLYGAFDNSLEGICQLTLYSNNNEVSRKSSGTL